MDDPGAIKQRNIDVTNARYGRFKAAAAVRSMKLPEALAEALDKWIDSDADEDASQQFLSGDGDNEVDPMVRYALTILTKPESELTLLEGILVNAAKALYQVHLEEGSKKRGKRA